MTRLGYFLLVSLILVSSGMSLPACLSDPYDPEAAGGTMGAAGEQGTGGMEPRLPDPTCFGSAIEREIEPLGCELAWGTNGNSGNRASYLEFITTWIGYEYTQGRLNDCDGCALVSELAELSAHVAYYAYFAGYALPDCNLSGPPNLCTNGAKWIRDNRDMYIDLYASYAEKTYEASPDKGVLWLLEGDFVQYTYEDQEERFTMRELGELARDIVCAIKGGAPNALVGMNHSTWISNSQAYEFWSEMPTELMDFVWTTGVGDNDGYFERSGSATSYNSATSRYDFLSGFTGLGIIVDTSFGASQMSDSWSNAPADVLNTRVNEGVIGINVTQPPQDYAERLSALRPQINPVCE